MRVVTEKVFERILDEALLNYTQLRFISDEEIADFKTEFFRSLHGNIAIETMDPEKRALYLTFKLKDNE